MGKKLLSEYKCIDGVIIKCASITYKVKIIHVLAHNHIDKVGHKPNFEFTEITNENDPIYPIDADNGIELPEFNATLAATSIPKCIRNDLLQTKKEVFCVFIKSIVLLCNS